MFDWYNSNLFSSKYKEYSITADSYCRAAWNNRRSKGRIKYNMDKIIDTDINNFGCDVFQILHDGEYEESWDGKRWGSEVLSAFVDNPEVELLMNTCGGDADFSAFATGDILKDVHEELSEIKTLFCQKHNIEEEIEKNKEDGNDTEDLEDQLFDLDFKINSSVQYTKSKISSSALQALQSVGDLHSMKHKGLLGESDDTDIEVAEKRFALVENILKNSSFKVMMKMAGRMLSLGDNALSETTDTPEEFIGITTGNKIDGIQLEDLAMLGDNDLELLFWADFADENLVIDLFQGTDAKGFGDIVLLTDISPSMNGTLGEFNGVAVSRHQATRAFAYAMHCEAKDRTVIELPFNHLCSRKIDNASESIELGVSGGTCFNNAFNASLDVIMDLNNPDIIMITDGEDWMDEHILHDLKNRGVRIWLYTIGNRHNDLLEKYSHRAFLIGSNIEQSIENLSVSMQASK
ncbi:MAG: vWA domain-containing protein [Vampirovibrionia bacterium]